MKISRGLFCLLTLPAVLGAATPETRELIESGNSYYRMGLYEEAGKQYLRAGQQDQESSEINFNLGNVYFQKYLEAKQAAIPGETSNRSSEWEQKAITAYKQAMASNSPTLRARALYNLGNTYAEAEKRDEAVTAYQEALRILPNDEDTKHNLELLLRGKKIPAQIEPTRIVKIKPGVTITNIVAAKGRPMAGNTHTNGVGKGMIQQEWGASGGEGAGQGANQAAGGGGLGGAATAGGGGQGTETALGGGEGTGGQLPGAAGTEGAASAAAGGKDDKSVKMEASTGGEKGDPNTAKAAAASESSGGKAVQTAPGAGGQAGTAEGKAGTASPDKTSNSKDKSAVAAAAQSDASKPKDQDKSAAASSAATDTLDPKRQEVLDKASKAEQRYINQWTRPPDMKKPKDQDW